MAIYMHHNQEKIHFRIFRQKTSEITAWRDKIDKEIFLEQYKTGSYKGQKQMNGSLLVEQMMKIQAEKGIYRPYYGDSGGGYGDIIHPLKTHCLYRAINSLSKDQFEFKALVENHLPDVEEKNEMNFLIDNGELENLKKWNQWNESQCLSGRYQFKFARIFLGKGWIIKIHDFVSETDLDITDYDSF
jgi:hypothetical protein